MDNIYNPRFNRKKGKAFDQLNAIFPLVVTLLGDIEQEIEDDKATLAHQVKEIETLREKLRKAEDKQRQQRQPAYYTPSPYPRSSTRRSARGPAPALGKPFTNNGLPVTGASASSVPKRRGRRPKKLDTAPAAGVDSAFTDDTKLPGFDSPEPSDV